LHLTHVFGSTGINNQGVYWRHDNKAVQICALLAHSERRPAYDDADSTARKADVGLYRRISGRPDDRNADLADTARYLLAAAVSPKRSLISLTQLIGFLFA